MSKYRLNVVEVTAMSEEEINAQRRVRQWPETTSGLESDVKYIRTLEVELTADEWQKVKKAVLGTW